MELLDADRSVLVVIDLQGKLLDLVHRSAQVKQVAHRLLDLAELFGVPVLLTEQYPRGLGPTQPDLADHFERLSVPHERLEKTSFGCCGDGQFELALSRLRPTVDASARQVVVCGIEAHVCVMQTVIELLADGQGVHVAWDGVSGRGAEYVERALQRMAQAGAVITNHESIGFEWARDKNHPAFKSMSRLFKGGQPG